MNDGKLAIRFDERGLVPAVLQDADTDEVLMVAWMNEEAVQLTLETGQAHFWSRSRRTLWQKGATSGHFMNVREILVDCDADTLLVRVDPAGPACHTGERSCFYRHLQTPCRPARNQGKGQRTSATHAAYGLNDKGGILRELFAVILDRQANRPAGSYTVKLLDAGENEILKKVGEEAIEVVLAATAEGDERVLSEIADLTYHLLVLLAARQLNLVDIETELAKRRD